MNLKAKTNLSQKPRLGFVTCLLVLCVWLGLVQVVEASREKYDVEVGRASGNMYTQMDTWMGINSDPQTLHKYLYTHADPVNNTDPTGNFTLGGLSIGIGTIARGISFASTGYEIFSLATGQSELSFRQLGTSILLSRLPIKYVKQIAKKHKQKTGKTLKIPCVGRPRNSFVAGTLVHTEAGLKPIEDIEIGDKVLSYNESTGKTEYQEVVHLISHENDYELINVSLNGEQILTTSEHPFYVNGSWKRADELIESDLLSLIDGYAQIRSLDVRSESRKVYNFTVANTHNYFVGYNGVLVHNEDRDCIPTVANMAEFFETAFGLGLKEVSRRSGKRFQGQTIYKVNKNSASLRKGDHYYLDGLHKDHLEVFDKNGKFRHVLNLDGSINIDKTAAAANRSISNIL